MSDDKIPDCLLESNSQAIRVAIEAAMEARRVLQHYWEHGVEIREKGPKDLVSQADTESETAITNRIRDCFPDHAILGEESGFTGPERSPNCWIIDPLDGTTNFAHRIPHFATSIAFYHEGEPQVGVIVNPITDEWYVAVRGKGAWYNGQQCGVSLESELGKTVVGFGFYYDRGMMMRSTLETIADFFQAGVHGVRRFGTASLDLGFVGRGLFGVFFEYQLSPWDYAAGRLFVEEAGGRVTDCSGRLLQLVGKSSVLATNGRLHEAAQNGYQQ